MKKKSAKLTAGVAALLAMAVVGGSFAYWNQTSTISNPFDTGKFGGATVTEDFKPDDGSDWQPGVEVNKDVYAVNSGDQDIIVRAKLDETWTHKGDTTPYKTNAAQTGTGTKGDVYTVSQNNATDGLTALDKSVVTKNFTASTNWVDGGDGWFYYKVNLAGGATTDIWLDSVELLNDVDLGKMETKYYISATNDPNPANYVWFAYTGTMPAYINASGVACAATAPGAQKVLHNKVETALQGSTVSGYSDSDYVLKVTVQTVQPTQEAIDAVFGGGSAFTAPAGTSWTIG